MAWGQQEDSRPRLADRLADAVEATRQGPATTAKSEAMYAALDAYRGAAPR